MQNFVGVRTPNSTTFTSSQMIFFSLPVKQHFKNEEFAVLPHQSTKKLFNLSYCYPLVIGAHIILRSEGHYINQVRLQFKKLVSSFMSEIFEKESSHIMHYKIHNAFSVNSTNTQRN